MIRYSEKQPLVAPEPEEVPEPKLTAKYKTQYQGPTYWLVFSDNEPIARVYPDVDDVQRDKPFRVYLTHGDTDVRMAFIGRFASLSNAVYAVKGCLEFALWPF